MSREQALTLARDGYRVFPVRADKRPLVQEWKDRASADERPVRSLWDTHPAAGVGIATGSGLVVVDLDCKNGADGVQAFTEWADEQGVQWEPTTTTRSGGQHVYFRAAEPYRNRVGVLPGVDVRGDGGYVVAYGDVPPLAELPPLPYALARLLHGERTASQQGSAEAADRQVGPEGVRRARSDECDRVQWAPEGQRNHTLNAAAYNLGQLIGDHLDEDEARAELLDAALACGLESDEALATIDSGLRSGMANPRAVVEPTDAPAGAWAAVDIAALRAGGLQQLEPTLLARTDGLCLLYPGRTHSISGESGSGKSWLVQWATAEALHAGHRALYLDYESSAVEVVQRLLILGCSWQELEDRFTYVNPDAAPAGAEFDALLATEYGLAVVDGVTESLGLSGIAGDNLTNSNDAVTRWHNMLPKRIATETGAAVVQVDHVTKAKDGRGGYAIGGQAKRASITGAAYVVQSRESFGRGRSGSFDLFVSKDRPGAVLAARGGDETTAGRHVARVAVQCAEDRVQLELKPAESARDALLDDTKRRIVEFLADLPEDHPGASGKLIRKEVNGRTEHKIKALDELVADGYVIREPRGKSRLHHLGRPYTDFDDEGLL